MCYGWKAISPYGVLFVVCFRTRVYRSSGPDAEVAHTKQSCFWFNQGSYSVVPFYKIIYIYVYTHTIKITCICICKDYCFWFNQGSYSVVLFYKIIYINVYTHTIKITYICVYIYIMNT